MMRRSVLALSLAAALHGCGGGGDRKQVVAYYGDSLAFGSVPPGGDARLPVPPAVRLAEYLPGWVVIDDTAGAATPREAMGWESLWNRIFPATPLPAHRLPFPAFAQHMLNAPEAVCLFRYGGADEVLGEDPLKFSQYLDQMVGLAQDAGKRVILVGMDGRTDRPDWRDFDARIRAIAEFRLLTYVDISAVPVTLIDGLHGDQATSDAWTRVIAQAVLA